MSWQCAVSVGAGAGSLAGLPGAAQWWYDMRGGGWLGGWVFWGFAQLRGWVGGCIQMGFGFGGKW
jgi:hypothetical protein